MTAGPRVTSFAEVSRIESTGQGRWSGDLDPRWTIGGRPNGGYLLALLGRAATAGSGRAHVLSASAQYLRAPAPGPVELEATVLRPGRGLTHVHARMRQGDQTCVEALLGTGELDDTSRADWTAPTTPPPSIPSSEAVRVPAVTPTGAEAAVMGQVAIDLDVDTAGLAPDAPTGRGEIAGWLALPGDAAFDDAALLYALDALPPASFTVAATGWVPTLSMTVYVRALPAPGPVHIRARAATISGGRVDETVWIHDSLDRLVAQGSQLAGIRLE